MPDDRHDWLRQRIGADAATHIGEVLVPVSDHRSFSLARLIRSWSAHVARLESELQLAPDHESAWGAHDFVAALIMRDMVAQGLRSLDIEMRAHVAPAVADIDRRFREFTEPDDDRCAERADGQTGEERDWWWQRIPTTGPARHELLTYYRSDVGS